MKTQTLTRWLFHISVGINVLVANLLFWTWLYRKLDITNNTEVTSIFFTIIIAACLEKLQEMTNTGTNTVFGIFKTSVPALVYLIYYLVT